ncbi:MAG: efflux RND transporter periplasmic adaptor subunit [Bacteroidetes bacterium]|nr:efflux RND transporter periplasmic adaptor subunit [Bacteroidota bacterium]
MKDIIQNIKQNFKLIIGVFVIGIFLGWLFFHSGGESAQQSQEMESHEGHDHESADPTTWTCSMHPQIKQDKPGDCPICGMDLIPLASMDSGGDDVDPNEITMSESAAKLASIQTMVVETGTPQKSIHLQGKIQEDERRISELTARFGGRIEELFVNFKGQNVRKGEKLATIYSPELVTSQRELLEAISYKETRPALYKAAKGKLKLWDLNDEQIKAIEENGEPQLYFDVLSPMSGTVTMRHVALGDYVKEGTALFKVVDLTRVWALFDAYESDLPWIKVNDEVEYTIQSLPGKTYSGKVSFIDPFIDGKTRVAKVRVDLKNPKLEIKPEMFTTGILESKIAGSGNEILIPKTALLWTGKRAVVYVKVQDRENPSFLYREIVLGPEAGNFYVVADGLNEGEEIAVNGVFKIDAASQLQGLPSMMNPDGGAGSTPHDMSKMDMGGGKKSEGSTQSEAHTEQMEMNKSMGKIDAAPAFIRQLTEVYNKYLVMKNGFVATDTKKVSAAAKAVQSAIKAVDMGLLKGNDHMVWMGQLGALEQPIQSIGQSNDIVQQRIEFAKFNLAFYKSLKTFGLSSTETYYQYCPMANGDKGAYWMSETKEIRNPYFGNVMLGCGENRETLK